MIPPLPSLFLQIPPTKQNLAKAPKTKPPLLLSHINNKPMEETTVIKWQLSTGTLTSPTPLLFPGDSPHAPLLPTLPFDLVVDILCRLPVKDLLHLRLSTTHRLHTIRFSAPSREYILTSYPLHSVFTTMASNVTQQLEFPPNTFDGKDPPNHLRYIVGSCDGILCLADYYECFVLLWNPSIRKFKELPLLEKLKVLSQTTTVYGFGYDAFTDNYKVVAVTYYPIHDSSGNWFVKTEVKVHTLGTNFCRSIQEFPFGVFPVEQSGKFVCGTINWLASTDWEQESPCVIVSLDLGKESYQEVLQPDYGGVVDADTFLTLGVLRDCLCMLSDHDFWIMKEFGNKESWTKLFTCKILVSIIGSPRHYIFLRMTKCCLSLDGIWIRS